MNTISSTLGKNLRSYAAFHPKQEAIVSPGFRITYQEYETLTNQFAHYLLEQGVKKGDRIPLFLGTNGSFPLSLLACAKIGAISVPINYRWNQELIDWSIGHLDAKYILLDSLFYPLVKHHIEKGTIQGTLVAENHQICPDFIKKLKNYPSTPPNIEVNPDDPCTITFTSGTTGKPKGVVSTHNAFLASGMVMAPFIDYYSRYLLATPLFHISGLMINCYQFYLGLTLVFLPELELNSFLNIIDKEQINFAFLPPNIFKLLLPIIYKSGASLSSLKMFLSGGTRVPVHTIQEYEKLGFELMQGYGATEGSGVLFAWTPKMGYDKAHTAGKPYLFPEFKILDPETRAELPQGEIGELAYRGPQLFKEYWKNPEATEKAFYNGWFLTGDAARVDEDGFIEIVDRYKDVIFFAGYGGIYPSEVEEVIREIPDIEDVSVVGVDDPQWSEIPCAFVRLKNESILTKIDILHYVHQKLERHKLMDVIFCDQPLPRNANGKIDKSQLKKLYLKLKSTPSL